MTSPIRVLLIEDNPGDADLTRDTLETGRVLVHVDVELDGARAIERLQREDVTLPDLVMLDLNLPGMDGREVLAAMKGNDRLRRIPVVVLTSSDAEQDIVKSYELGASCYVTKPVGLAAFQTIVRSVENFWFTVVKLP